MTKTLFLSKDIRSYDNIPSKDRLCSSENIISSQTQIMQQRNHLLLYQHKSYCNESINSFLSRNKTKRKHGESKTLLDVLQHKNSWLIESHKIWVIAYKELAHLTVNRNPPLTDNHESYQGCFASSTVFQRALFYKMHFTVFTLWCDLFEESNKSFVVV